ncbi:chromate transporter [Spirosoma arboris]
MFGCIDVPGGYAPILVKINHGLAPFACLYQQYGQLPQVQPFLYGVIAAVVALIVSALMPLAKKALKSTELAILGALTVIACLLGVNGTVALFSRGFVGILLHPYLLRDQNRVRLLQRIILQILTTEAAIAKRQIFQTFFNVGFLRYGTPINYDKVLRLLSRKWGLTCCLRLSCWIYKFSFFRASASHSE